jgi:hypothetical protein
MVVFFLADIPWNGKDLQHLIVHFLYLLLQLLVWSGQLKNTVRQIHKPAFRIGPVVGFFGQVMMVKSKMAQTDQAFHGNVCPAQRGWIGIAVGIVQDYPEKVAACEGPFEEGNPNWGG